MPGMAPMKNVSGMVCESTCDANSRCTAFSMKRLNPMDFRASHVDCYFQAAVNLSECDYSDKTWTLLKQTAPPPTTGIVVYHLFESKYTGVANKDAGSFKGDTGFIFGTFTSFAEGNPEASMESNIIEMTDINVTGWGKYEECNAPGANESKLGFFCPKNRTSYCCTTGHDRKPANHTKTSLPGLEVNFQSLGAKYGFPGWWYSFPMESENVTWTQKTLRRISGLCMGNAWRKDAGGCSECDAKWDTLDKCVADCVQRELVPDGDVTALQKTWDRVFADPAECPDVPFKPASEVEASVVHV